MPDLDELLTSLAETPEQPLPGAAAARRRGDQRRRRSRRLAAGGAAALVLAASAAVGGGLVDGSRESLSPARPAPSVVPSPAVPAPTDPCRDPAAPVCPDSARADGDLLLDATDLTRTFGGTWQSDEVPQDRGLPSRCQQGPEPLSEALSSYRSGDGVRVAGRVLRFTGETAASRGLGELVDAVEACPSYSRDGVEVSQTLVGGIPGEGPDLVYGTVTAEGQDDAWFALLRVGDRVHAASVQQPFADEEQAVAAVRALAEAARAKAAG